MIFKLIWRNIWRNKRRTLITMSSVTFAVLLAVTMKSLQKGVFDHLVKNMVSFYTGYIQVHKTGYNDEQILENSFEENGRLKEVVHKIAGVESSGSRIESFVLASTGETTYGCMLTGIVPEDEINLTKINSRVISGNYFSKHEKSCLIAEGLAKKLNVKTNDTLILLGQGFRGSTAAGKYFVKGILRYGSPSLNDMLIFLPLEETQEFLGTGKRITTLAIMINNPEKLDEIKNEITGLAGKDYEVLSWKNMMPDIESHIRADSFNFYLFIGVLYLLVAFGIFGTILMMLAERNYELGMLMAIGTKRIRIILMLIGETILISVLGTLCGIALSYPVVRYFESNPIRFSGDFAEVYTRFGFEPIWPATLDGAIFITQALIIFGLALLISLYPSVSVLRMNIMSSIKR